MIGLPSLTDFRSSQSTHLLVWVVGPYKQTVTLTSLSWFVMPRAM